ncbi:MAG: SUMF1/EgtB/PvdO family nonheme iron enzyme, partial [Blastocatellia bacterium]|nr:SUMF1/EgtB/PvdO family nonheme iron enzyme [Blastocatellia bacterium]
MLKKDDKIGPYTLVSRLGRGQFGEVWLAEKRGSFITTKFALKFIVDEETTIETLKKEAYIWSKASGHPNILPIVDADSYDDQVVIASEYAPDGSLGKWLKDRGDRVSTIEAAIRMVSGILDGLDHLHNCKIVHRDLKPDNILLQGGIPRLADFGLSRILGTTAKSTKAAGTYSYMPPESFEGKLSFQSDIWAAGVIFYQLLCGKLPFPQPDPMALMYSIISKPPDPLPDTIHSSIKDIVSKALEKDLEKRYKTATEMKQALQAVNVSSVRVEYVGSPQDDVTTEKIIPPTENLRLKTYKFKTVRLNNRGAIVEEREGLAGYYEEDLGNGIVLEMVQIPGGSFLMGSKEGEGYDSERPQHEVTVPSFYMGKYQVTQEQWKAMMGNNPSRFKGDPLPVESIKWEQAKEFCKKLSEKTGKEYRLPSEAEWEYACRAGTETPFAFGETITTEIVNYNGNSPYANAPKGQFRGKTVEVGSLGVANQFGLYDMHGNVWEW